VITSVIGSATAVLECQKFLRRQASGIAACLRLDGSRIACLPLEKQTYVIDRILRNMQWAMYGVAAALI
jgi:hypothetical protein